VQKASKVLSACRLTVEATTGVHADLTAAWDALAKASAVQAANADKNEELGAARTLLKLLGDLPVDSLLQQTKDAEVTAQKQPEELGTRANQATVEEPLSDDGKVVPRRLAVGIGVGLSVVALLLSYLSVRVASNRRLATLIPLREAAKSSQPGLHAAA